MNQLFYKIKCITNLHVGSGKANYGVIDQLVQRDPTYQYPTIHASSLKGGIKEYCSSISFSEMKKVFGSEKGTDGKTDHDHSEIGTYKFFDANLLAIPVRCDKQAFVHITCPNILTELSERLPDQCELRKSLLPFINELSNETFIAMTFSENLNDATIEDFDIQAKYVENVQLDQNIKDLFNNYEIVIVKNNYFDRLVNDLHLPVIARNYLENGESQNLWYEQVVPRLSLFWSTVLYPDNDVLFTELFKGNVLVQIGANGSIGYGYSSFSEIKSN
ncbi:MAG TPA: type III-B CRISPR module RAMP protein Cmr4 [Paludibacteraceae bacterium]|mgnify:CR=1 FL=1|nr:type III-B CRISPR module RAMP protein Cmr4 [Paludibacteraceae bacterium]